jgi:hypothetical protein
MSRIPLAIDDLRARQHQRHETEKEGISRHLVDNPRRRRQRRHFGKISLRRLVQSALSQGRYVRRRLGARPGSQPPEHLCQLHPLPSPECVAMRRDNLFDARAARTAARGKKPGGKPPEPPTAGPLPKDQINLTDEDSRIMPVAGGGFEIAGQAQNIKLRRI